MIKIFFESKEKYFVLLVAVFLFINASCSRQIYPVTSFHNIENLAERIKMNAFMNAGTGKVVNTHSTSPNEIIKTAQNFLGVPHCMGGTTIKCMDCSGLLVTVFARNGILMPHNSEEQARYGKIIHGMDELMQGDLVFFVRSYKTSRFITHSGIYVGNSKFIHSSTKSGVTITSLYDPWWHEKFIFGTRVFE